VTTTPCSLGCLTSESFLEVLAEMKPFRSLLHRKTRYQHTKRSRRSESLVHVEVGLGENSQYPCCSCESNGIRGQKEIIVLETYNFPLVPFSQFQGNELAAAFRILLPVRVLCVAVEATLRISGCLPMA